MGTGIAVCGMNGAGKSTLGRALAEEWARSLDCPVLRVDGTKPVEEDTARIRAWML